MSGGGDVEGGPGGGAADGDLWAAGLADEPFGPEPEDLAAADRAGGRMVVGTAHVLAGLLAAGLLDYARSPGALVELLCPAVPPGPERDRLVFAAGAAAGLSAGSRRSGRRWDPGELQAVAEELYEAGFEAMGGLVERTGAVWPAPWEIG